MVKQYCDLATDPTEAAQNNMATSISNDRCNFTGIGLAGQLSHR
jgi:hypothetical protein